MKKDINMSIPTIEKDVVIAECSITDELPKIKKADLILGEFSKTVDLENGKAVLRMSKTELTLQGKKMNGKNLICEMHQKLVQ